MKRTLITGATGFVGANLARRLLQDGHEIHLLVRAGYAGWRVEAIRADVQIHEVNLQDPQALQQSLRGIRPDWVFHLAVHGAYSTQTSLRQMVDTNIMGTINLVEACLGVGFEAFVNTGSSSEYGFKQHAPNEREWLEPNSYYAVTKASATLFCSYVARSQGVHLPTLRLYSVFGQYEEPTRLIPTLIVRGLKGELPPLVNPDIARDYIYIDDVTDAYLLAATQPGQEVGAVYNLGVGRQITLREVVQIVRQVLDISAEPAWGSMPNRQWDTSIWMADNRKIKSELGWQPRYTFEQGFRTFVDWFRNDPAHMRIYDQLRIRAN